MLSIVVSQKADVAKQRKKSHEYRSTVANNVVATASGKIPSIRTDQLPSNRGADFEGGNWRQRCVTNWNGASNCERGREFLLPDMASRWNSNLDYKIWDACPKETMLENGEADYVVTKDIRHQCWLLWQPSILKVYIYLRELWCVNRRPVFCTNRCKPICSRDALPPPS